MRRPDTSEQAAENMTELADALAEALPAAVIDRLQSDLDDHGQKSVALILELALSRKRGRSRSSEPSASDADGDRAAA
ncbi:MAG: hypothetical protein ACR2PA_26865, partial [Hyphomicrobiaceae bacterium]